MAHVGEESALEIGRFAQLGGILIELGIERENALVGFREFHLKHREFVALPCHFGAQILEIPAG